MRSSCRRVRTYYPLGPNSHHSARHEFLPTPERSGNTIEDESDHCQLLGNGDQAPLDWKLVLYVRMRNLLPVLLTLCVDVVDLLLSKDLARVHIIDFNPYVARTDPLLFTYEEVATLSSERSSRTVPILRVIHSPAHTMANRNAPDHQHNMVPLEAFALGWDENALAEIRRADAEASEPEEA